MNVYENQLEDVSTVRQWVIHFSHSNRTESDKLCSIWLSTLKMISTTMNSFPEWKMNHKDHISSLHAINTALIKCGSPHTGSCSLWVKRHNRWWWWWWWWWWWLYAKVVFCCWKPALYNKVIVLPVSVVVSIDIDRKHNFWSVTIHEENALHNIRSKVCAT